MSAAKTNEKNTQPAVSHPVTMEDHKNLNRTHIVKKTTAVSDALGFPDGDQFEQDLTEILLSDAEASGEIVVIALCDSDHFDHINKDFGCAEGDRVLIETGRHIRASVPGDARVYRIGGDEFGIIFRGNLEREDIFLILNEMKNTLHVSTPDGVRQSITVGMATAFQDASRTPELIRKADSAVFRGKAAGGNRVAMAREEKMVPKTSHYTQDQLQRLARAAKQEGVGEAILLREALDMLLKKYDV